MKFKFPQLGREQMVILLVSGIVFFVIFLFWRRVHLNALAQRAKVETENFINAAAANSPPPGSDFSMAQDIPIYPGSEAQ